MPTSQSQAVASRWTCTAGTLDNLKLHHQVDIGPLPVTPFAITVRVDHFGLNFADMFACLGLYSATPTGEFVPGLEFSGTVEAVRDARSCKLKPGDRVFGVTRFGGYTSRLHADSRYVKRIPEGWTTAEGAAFPAQALTAWYGLVELGGLSKATGKQSVVLVHSGAGGTGLWAIKICQYFGAKCVVTVGSAEKVEAVLALTSLTADQVIDRGQCGGTNDIHIALRSSLNAIGAPGFTHIFDSLLGSWFTPGQEALQPMGRHIVLGAGSMTPPGSRPNWLRLAFQYLKRPLLDPLAMISVNKSVMCFNLIWLYEKVEDVDRIFADLLKALPVMGKPHIGHTFDLESLPAALRLFQSGRTVGKVVIAVHDGATEEGATQSPRRSVRESSSSPSPKRKRNR